MDPSEKRKREDERENAERNKSRKAEEVDEVEVEEFFAILRRIHVAVKYFENADGSGRRKMTATMNAWKPSFEVEDFQFQGDDGVSKDGGVESRSCTARARVADNNNLGLDLNSEPTFEGEQEKDVV